MYQLYCLKGPKIQFHFYACTFIDVHSNIPFFKLLIRLTHNPFQWYYLSTTEWDVLMIEKIEADLTIAKESRKVYFTQT